MIFVRTALGALLVASLIALAGLGFRLWEVQRQLAARVQALERRQPASADAERAAIRACFERFHDAVREGDFRRAMGQLTPHGQKVLVFEAYGLLTAFSGRELHSAGDPTATPDAGNDELDRILRRHLGGMASVGELTASEGAEVSMNRVAEAIDDRAAFVADVFHALRTRCKPFRVTRPALTDVRVHGDEASAQLLTVMEAALTAEPVKFRRVDGRWRFEPWPTGSFGESLSIEAPIVKATAPKENAEIVDEEVVENVEPEVP
jgi:hypothetical protein